MSSINNLHPRSFLLQGYIVDVIEDLIPPLEDIELQERTIEDEDEEVDGLQSLQGDFRRIAMLFANVDGHLAESEMNMCVDILNLLEPDEDVCYTTTIVRQMWEKHERRFAEALPPIPLSVFALERYDWKNGTYFAYRAKAMFYQFAKAIVHADDKVRTAEQKRLTTFEEELFSESRRRERLRSYYGD